MLPRKTFWKEKEAKAETWRLAIFNAQAEEEASKKEGGGSGRCSKNKTNKNYESSEFRRERLKYAPPRNNLQMEQCRGGWRGRTGSQTLVGLNGEGKEIMIAAYSFKKSGY